MNLHLLFNQDEINKAVYDLAERIRIDYRGKNVVFIGILKGSFIFLSDLARKTNLPASIDFISVESYGKRTTQGKIRLIKDIAVDIKDAHVIVVDDISDSGNTLNYVVGKLKKKRPASLKTCTIMKRVGLVDNGDKPDYYALLVPEGDWVVGYGMDEKEQGRILPNIYVSRKEK